MSSSSAAVKFIIRYTRVLYESKIIKWAHSQPGIIPAEYYINLPSPLPSYPPPKTFCLPRFL